MNNIDKVSTAVKNCSENSCGEDCYCYMQDDCKLNHLTDSERKLLDNKMKSK